MSDPLTAAFSGLQEQLQELFALKENGLLSVAQHDAAVNSVLAKFGLRNQGGATRDSESSATSVSSSSTSSSSSSSSASQNENRVEILIHNLSHGDLVLSINRPDLSLATGSIIARPKV